MSHHSPDAPPATGGRHDDGSAPSDAAASRTSRRTAPATPRTPLVLLSTFVILTLALGWLIGLPLVLMDPPDRLEAPLDLFYNLFMLSPTLAAVVVHLLERRQSARVLYGHLASPQNPDDATSAEAPEDQTTRLRPQSFTDALGITPLRPVSRMISWSILGIMLFFVFSMAALPIGGLLGVYAFDPSMPVFVQDLGQRLGHEPTEFIATGLLVEAGVIFASAVGLVFLHVGTEIGWRGWFFPRAQLRWGTTRAVLITGAANGLWFAPLLAVGFFYDQANVFQAMGLMIGFCIVIGGILAWLRMRSGSIWPAAFAQSMITAATILAYWFTAFGEQLDFRHSTLQGWSGWLLPAALLGVLLLARRRSFAPASA
ncbi:CPBP family intramembrane glutamic endopeptidase [Nesterenkonia xinjiangensis]|uniref:Membrane protease YdiL (CAAX protease family) n=1 Tax=Nesterenkonia xinjiangensis TaxID=225327 RepID=A0A7Z0KAQ9_9MICC|nr:type II CAAX endopeptidase family protein [Nesterenkonia xinjiangensis]NYJ78545.1 membrane protease YdiL (CAAX protease family) [Nesterenkonia xinjiangensis]